MLGRWHIGPALVSFVLVCILVGCSTGRSVPTSQIPGTYEITYEPFTGTVLGTEKLVLRANGTYEQTFTPTGGKPWTSTGRWAVDRSTNNSGICLYDYMEGLDPWGDRVLPKPKRSNWFTSVDYGYGCIAITVNPDNGYYFRKVKHTVRAEILRSLPLRCASGSLRSAPNEPTLSWSLLGVDNVFIVSYTVCVASASDGRRGIVLL